MYKTEFSDWFDSISRISPIFSHLGSIARVVENRGIPFAAVQWDKQRRGIDFLINPDSFARLSAQEKQFVICHEAMHILFGHLDEWISGHYDLHRMNIATDILINESLFTHFGFQRDSLPNLENICTFANVFSPQELEEHHLSLSSSWKEIYTALENHQLLEECKTLEDHINEAKTPQNDGEKGMEESGETTESDDGDKPADSDNPPDTQEADKKGRISLEISLEDCLDMQRLMRGEKPEDTRTERETVEEGEAGESIRDFAFAMFQSDKQHKWEKLLSFVEPSRFSPDRGEKRSFAMPNTVIGHVLRRQNLRLPARICRNMPKKNKIRLYFFWDISPSCLPYKEWFEDIVAHIPPNRFDVSVYAFDTVCHRLQLDYGTGLVAQEIQSKHGTNFNALQPQIDQDLADGEIPHYPDMVCVLTDGMAKPVVNIPEEYRNRWMWLITGLNEEERSNSFELGFVNLADNIIKRKIIPVREDYDIFNPQVKSGGSWCKMMPAYILD